MQAAISLKEKRAAEKQAKKIKKLERAAKPKAAPKFQVDMVQLRTYSNRKRLMLQTEEQGAELFTDEQVAQQAQIMQKQFDDLIYYRNIAETMALFEMQIRAAQAMADFLMTYSVPRANDLRETANKAIDEVQKYAQVYDMSPNQRREVFKDTKLMGELMLIWLGAFSHKHINAILAVNTATQICHYFADLCENLDDVRDLLAVINGANSRERAAKRGLKEREFKLKLFQAAKPLYRIALTQTPCVEMGLFYPSSIPELRQKALKHLANFDFLAQISGDCFHDVIKPFKREFGIDLLGVAKFENKSIEHAKNLILQGF